MKKLKKIKKKEKVSEESEVSKLKKDVAKLTEQLELASSELLQMEEDKDFVFEQLKSLKKEMADAGDQYVKDIERQSAPFFRAAEARILEALHEFLTGGSVFELQAIDNNDCDSKKMHTLYKQGWHYIKTDYSGPTMKLFFHRPKTPKSLEEFTKLAAHFFKSEAQLNKERAEIEKRVAATAGKSKKPAKEPKAKKKKKLKKKAQIDF